MPNGQHNQRLWSSYSISGTSPQAKLALRNRRAGVQRPGARRGRRHVVLKALWRCGWRALHSAGRSGNSPKQLPVFTAVERKDHDRFGFFRPGRTWSDICAPKGTDHHRRGARSKTSETYSAAGQNHSRRPCRSLGAHMCGRKPGRGRVLLAPCLRPA